MKRIAMLVLAVLASGWFIPVSCSTASMVLAEMSAAETERAWTPQDKRIRFHVVARPGEGNAPFRVLALAELPEFKSTHTQVSFLMEQDSGRIDDEPKHEWVIYRVLSRTPAGQEIEVDHEDGDDQRFSRYRATATDVEPISTRYGPVSRGIVIMAVVYGFGLALLIFVAALILKPIVRRHLAPPSEPK